MTKKINLALVSGALILGLASCKKSPIDKLGRDICPSEGFELSADDIMIEGLNGDGKADLEAQGLKIKVEFGEKLRWNMKLTSPTSEKTYSGDSDSIVVYWAGNADKFPVFQEGDVKIEVELPCTDVVEKSFEVITKPTFKNLDPHFGILIRDWDQNGVKAVATSDTASAADGYFYGAGVKVHDYMDTLPSPMGGKYYKMRGAADEPVWWYGANEIPGCRAPIFQALSTVNPDSVWFNLYARKGLGQDNVGVQVVLLADDSEGSNKQYQLLQDITWEGWKFISVKMSDIVKGGSASMDSISQAKTIILNLGSQPLQSKEAEVNYDFMILTVGEPFFKE